MEWLRRLIPEKQHITPSAVENNGESFLTRDEANAFAVRDSHRDLIVVDSLISYVTYSGDFDDYCRVQITFDERDRGTYTIQLLPLEDRTAKELVDDSKILAIAKRDRRLNAVRLYRHHHRCTLAEAIERVAELERLNDNDDKINK